MNQQPPELRILLMLATDRPQTVAFKLSRGQKSARALRAWMNRLAADLDAAGYNGDAVRLLLRPARRHPRMTLFTDLAGEDLRSARRHVSADQLAPARCDPSKAQRSFRNLAFMSDVPRGESTPYGYSPRLVHENGLWRLRNGMFD